MPPVSGLMSSFALPPLRPISTGLSIADLKAQAQVVKRNRGPKVSISPYEFAAFNNHTAGLILRVPHVNQDRVKKLGALCRARYLAHCTDFVIKVRRSEGYHIYCGQYDPEAKPVAVEVTGTGTAIVKTIQIGPLPRETDVKPPHEGRDLIPTGQPSDRARAPHGIEHDLWKRDVQVIIHARRRAKSELLGRSPLFQVWTEADIQPQAASIASESDDDDDDDDDSINFDGTVGTSTPLITPSDSVGDLKFGDFTARKRTPKITFAESDTIRVRTAPEAEIQVLASKPKTRIVYRGPPETEPSGDCYALPADLAASSGIALRKRNSFGASNFGFNTSGFGTAPKWTLPAARARSADQRQEQEDEWYIPYKPPSHPYPDTQGQGGIGASPAPVRSNNNHLFSFFSTTSSRYSGDFDTHPHSHSYGRSVPFPRKSPSYGSLRDREVNPQSLASSTSVPTGLAAPKMLFSPLKREMNQAYSSNSSSSSINEPRRRVQSSPYYPSDPKAQRWAAQTVCDLLVFPRPNITPHLFTPPVSPPEDSSIATDSDIIEMGRRRMAEREQWAKSHHTLSQRGRSRQRSLSFGEHGPSPGAPIIGSASARREEAAVRERRRSRSASGGIGLRRRASSFNAGSNRSSATYVRPHLERRQSNKSMSSVRNALAGCGLPRSRSVVDLGISSADYEPDGSRRDLSRGHSHTKSVPALSATAPDLQPLPRLRSQPVKSVRVRTPLRAGEVVVIAANEPTGIDFSKPLPPTPLHSGPPSLHIAPVPPFREDIGLAITDDTSSAVSPAQSTPTPLPTFRPAPAIPGSVSGSAVAPPSSFRSPTRSTFESTPSHARSALAKQHQRALTRRAFATPSAGPKKGHHQLNSSITSSQAGLLSASTNSTYSIPPQTPTSAASPLSGTAPLESDRRPTALDEAIGRARAGSVGQLDEGAASRLPTRRRPRTAEESSSSGDSKSTTRPTPLQLSTSTRDSQASSGAATRQTHDPPLSPAIPHPISTIPSPRLGPSPFAESSRLVEVPRQVAIAEPASVERPRFAHADTMASGKTVYTDASEGWDRSAAASVEFEPRAEKTPSPDEGEEDKDFHGLFFKTPQDPSMGFKRELGSTSSTDSSIRFPLVTPAQPSGLGFDIPEDEPVAVQLRRESSEGVSEESNTISTPYMAPAGEGRVGIKQIAETRRGSLASSGASGGNAPNQFMSDYALAQAATSTPGIAEAGKRRSLPLTLPSSSSRLSKPLSPKTFGVDLPATPQDELASPPAINFTPAPLPDLASPRRKSVGSPLIGSPLAESIIDRRDSAAVSFINDFPAPPTQVVSETMKTEIPPGQHASAFGQLVTGPPGAGKTTYCHGMHQFLTALNRPVHIINLDPAVPNPPYPCAINVSELVTLQEVMDEHGLGPNGAMLYCVEYLERNFDWLVERLDEVLGSAGDGGGGGYVIFDTPGQVELWTNHDSLKRIVERLMKLEYRLAAVHLSDAHYITDGSKFISVVLLALRAMLQLEMPHINVLSKIDLLSTYGNLPFDLRYYTEARELGYLLNSLESGPRSEKMQKLNKAMVELVEEYSLVGFETLAVEDKQSMLHLLRQIDKATGYIFVPSASSTAHDPHAVSDNAYALFSSGAGEVPGWDVQDVEERWGERKEEWDEVEREAWKREAEQRAERTASRK